VSNSNKRLLMVRDTNGHQAKKKNVIKMRWKIKKKIKNKKNLSYYNIKKNPLVTIALLLQQG
jgi:hypothetical protein